MVEDSPIKYGVGEDKEMVLAQSCIHDFKESTCEVFPKRFRVIEWNVNSPKKVFIEWIRKGPQGLCRHACTPPLPEH